MMSRITSVALILGLVGGGLEAHAGQAKVDVIQYYSSTVVTLKEETPGELFDFCTSYLNAGKSTVTSVDEDVRISCVLRPRTTKVVFEIGYSVNTVAQNPVQQVVLVEAIGNLNGLSSLKPITLVETQKGYHFRAEIDETKIQLDFRSGLEPYWSSGGL